ncbi:hypothetical protein [Aegicerativicinus sediminis]|uniref:hypothetical protein n=1 Tax=Aegicerativicinus sediminis TaxID=2893202 RepID=UPI001E5CA10C|nr:hypothetical protein [Aegicerativicinus sediminis]
MNFKLKTSLMILLSLGSGGVFAQNPSRELSGLVNMRAAYLDQEMKDKGYTFVKGDKSDTDSYTYYWNNRSKKCVTARTNNGTVKSIVETSAIDCGKSDSNSNNGNNGNNGNWRNDTESQAYQRGYSDGRSNKTRFDRYGSQIQMNAYSRGYNDGREGKRRDPYYSNNSNNSGGGNNRPREVKWRDLGGWLATSAYDELQARGFRQVKDHQQGGKTYRVWYHNRTKQCIKTVSENKNIKEILESDSCD